jgi:hypothetical protein
MEEQNKLKIQGFLLVMFGLLFQPRIQSRYSGKVAKSFLRFQGSRPGLFYDLSARETCPLRCSPAPSEREPGLPPHISREKTAVSHQSLRKDLATFLQSNLIAPSSPTNSYKEPSKFCRHRRVKPICLKSAHSESLADKSRHIVVQENSKPDS